MSGLGESYFMACAASKGPGRSDHNIGFPPEASGDHKTLNPLKLPIILKRHTGWDRKKGFHATAVHFKMTARILKILTRLGYHGLLVFTHAYTCWKWKLTSSSAWVLSSHESYTPDSFWGWILLSDESFYGTASLSYRTMSSQVLDRIRVRRSVCTRT